MPVPRRRQLLAAAAGGLAALAGCRPAVPGRVPLTVAGELVPAYLLQTPYQNSRPQVAMSFGAWPPGAAASAVALDQARFADPGARRALLPLDARLSLLQFTPAGLSPGPWAAFSAGGAQLGVPMVQSRLAVVYDGAAVSAVPPDWTLEDLLVVLGGVQATGRQALADLAGFRTDIWAALAAGRGGTLVAPNGALPLVAPAAAVQAWLDLGRLAAYARPGARLARGGAAVAFRFFLRPTDVDALENAGLHVGVARFPGGAVPARAWGHGIAAGAPEPGAALQFLIWTAEAECQRTLWSAGYVPVIAALAGALRPLGASAGSDPGALVPDARADRFLPPPLRLSGAGQAAFEAALGAASPAMSAADAAAAYAQAAAVANAALAGVPA